MFQKTARLILSKKQQDLIIEPMLICTNLNSVFYSMWTPFTVHQDSTISKGDPPKKIWLINSHIYKVCNNLSQIYHEIEALEKLTIQIHSTIVSSHSLGFPKLWSINMYKQHLSIIFLVCLLETPFFDLHVCLSFIFLVYPCYPIDSNCTPITFTFIFNWMDIPMFPTIVGLVLYNLPFLLGISY